MNNKGLEVLLHEAHAQEVIYNYYDHSSGGDVFDEIAITKDYVYSKSADEKVAKLSDIVRIHTYVDFYHVAGEIPTRTPGKIIIELSIKDGRVVKYEMAIFLRYVNNFVRKLIQQSGRDDIVLIDETSSTKGLPYDDTAEEFLKMGI